MRGQQYSGFVKAQHIQQTQCSALQLLELVPGLCIQQEGVAIIDKYPNPKRLLSNVTALGILCFKLDYNKRSLSKISFKVLRHVTQKRSGFNYITQCESSNSLQM